MIAAEGEHKASRALRHAAEVIADSPAALQVLIDFKQTRDKEILHCVCSHWTDKQTNQSYIVFVPASLPANLEQHLGREQQHDRLPSADRHHLPVDGALSCESTRVAKNDLNSTEQ